MELETYPLNPLVAVTHTNPYPYYAELVEHRPFYFDKGLGIWVASSAAMVRAVLTHPVMRVRPPTEPVPAALLGSTLDDMFGRLIRMNDGKYHSELKPVIASTFGGLNLAEVTRLSRKYSRMLLKEADENTTPGALTKFAFQLPVYVVAHLLGVADNWLPQVCRWVEELVVGLVPASASASQLEAAKVAAAYLIEILNTLLSALENESTNYLLSRFSQAGQEVGGAESAVIVANAIGFLSQSYEATAGLICNSLLTLALHSELLTVVQARPELAAKLVQEVGRYDPPVQNTRRFLAADTSFEGQQLKAGETVLVLLAAANRDPSANSEPQRFDLSRTKTETFSFGAGSHRCPGKNVAELIAEAAIKGLLSAGFVPDRLPQRLSYRSSLNVRIPIL
jgi:cytochrome P450